MLPKAIVVPPAAAMSGSSQVVGAAGGSGAGGSEASECGSDAKPASANNSVMPAAAAGRRSFRVVAGPLKRFSFPKGGAAKAAADRPQTSFTQIRFQNALITTRDGFVCVSATSTE